MKKLYIAIAAVSMLFAFASCDRTDPYLYNGNPIDPSKGEGSYVTFGGDPAITIREDAGSFTIPVRVLGSHGDFSVTINAVDGTAKNNKHYKIAEPATGVLEFSAADTVKIVKPMVISGI